MRRPHLGHRVRICLCGLVVTAGCSHNVAGQDTPCVVQTPASARIVWSESTSTGQERGADFDLQALRAELEDGLSLCLPVKSPLASHAEPGSAAAGPAPVEDRAQAGIDVIQVPLAKTPTIAEICAEGSAGRTDGTTPAYLPAPVSELPVTPPLPVPPAQLGFFDEAFDPGCDAASAPP